MPRPKSPNVFQVTVLIPEDARELADELAGRMAPDGVTLTRTDVLRAALIKGLAALAAEHPSSRRR